MEPLHGGVVEEFVLVEHLAVGRRGLAVKWLQSQQKAKAAAAGLFYNQTLWTMLGLFSACISVYGL